jgi:vacuolar-type H+-ATPase subunit E/Vma4
VQAYLGISPAARQHLTSSRVEFLKAVREILNDRIEHLSSQGQKGTKVAVE